MSSLLLHLPMVCTLELLWSTVVQITSFCSLWACSLMLIAVEPCFNFVRSEASSWRQLSTVQELIWRETSLVSALRFFRATCRETNMLSTTILYRYHNRLMKTQEHIPVLCEYTTTTNNNNIQHGEEITTSYSSLRQTVGPPQTPGPGSSGK